MARVEGSKRRQQILMALAEMLEESGGRITTAAVAKRVGVSEAALYRHFPSKAKMLEGLIDFAEEEVFSRIGQIVGGDRAAADACGAILHLLLSFTERNRWFARLAVGSGAVAEYDHLRRRAGQFFDRAEMQCRQVIRTAQAALPYPSPLGAQATANIMLAMVEGRIHQFVRSEFRLLPTTSWNEQWAAVSVVLFPLPPTPTQSAPVRAG